MQKNLQTALCLGVITIFVSIVVTPAVGTLYTTAFEQFSPAQKTVQSEVLQKQQVLVELTVTEYQADGTTAADTIWLPYDKAMELKNALEITPKLRDQMTLLIQYQVLPPDACLDTITTDIEKQAANIDVIPADNWLPPLSIMFFSQISANFRGGTWTRIGMTPFLDLLDRLLGIDFNNGFDFYDFCWGLRGSVYTSGPLGEHSLILEPGLIMMGGFIGYTVEGLLLRHSFYGAAMVTCVAGLGSHDFEPWFP